MIPSQITKQLVKIPNGQTLSSLVLSIKVLDTSKIKIYRDNVQVTAYSVSGSTITFNPAIAGACTLSVMSDEPLAREFDITKATEWNAATVNRQLDELQLQIQQVRDVIGLVLQPSDDKPYTPADMQDIVNTTIASKDIAVTKASEAKASATSAASSASSALDAKNLAVTSAETASSAAITAVDWANSATASATSAALSESNSAISADIAITSSDKAVIAQQDATISAASAKQSAEINQNLSNEFFDYIQKVAPDVRFPMDCGSVTDPIIYRTIDLGGIA